MPADGSLHGRRPERLHRFFSRLGPNDRSDGMANVPNSRALVVDDEPICAKLAGRMLEKKGFEVVLAYSGNEAKQRLSSERFDLLVTDWMMPDCDGIEIVRHARRTGDRLFVVVSSSLTSEAARQHALSSGANFVLPKPLDGALLAEALDHVPRTHRNVPQARPLTRLPPHLGRYTLGELIGSGGMGRVHEAKDENGSVVAIKSMLANLVADPMATRRFLREAQIAKLLHHPNVLGILGADVDDSTGAPYLVMERLRGRSLGDWLEHRGALPPGVAARVFRDVCRGLASVHAAGIVHRDVKPANIFLHVEPNDEVIPKLCDLGLARELGGANPRLTQAGSLVGTPLYMSPEQLRGAQDADVRADVFSVGVTLYEALTGDIPWPESTMLAEFVATVCHQPPVAIETVAPWVDPALCRVVVRAIHADPTLRFQTIEALANALEPFADSKLSTADLERPLEKTAKPRPLVRKWRSSRSPTWAVPVAFGAAMIAIVALFFTAAWLAFGARG